MPSLATVDLSGRTVLEVVPRGKHLLTRLSGGLTLHTHFRMDGSWHLYRPGDRWTGGPDWQVRAVLETASWQAVGYRLPVVDCWRPPTRTASSGTSGPTCSGPTGTPTRRCARLLAEPDREVGLALLDQRNLAGLGNLYRCEVLFLRGSPRGCASRDVPDLPALVDKGRRLLLANRDRWEQSTTGSLRHGEMHWVFERSGKPCRRCGTRIAHGRAGRGSARPADVLVPALPARPGAGPVPPPGPPRPPARPHLLPPLSADVAVGTTTPLEPCAEGRSTDGSPRGGGQRRAGRERAVRRRRGRRGRRRRRPTARSRRRRRCPGCARGWSTSG